MVFDEATQSAILDLPLVCLTTANFDLKLRDIVLQQPGQVTVVGTYGFW
jgi:hypothetical protein